jgi:hypothetical protein
MDRTDVKKSQAKQISQAMFPKINYLFRLRESMEKVGFPPNDKLYLLVCNAYEAMQELSVEVHYLSCDGVGRPSKNEELEQLEQNSAATQIDSS